MNTQTSIQMEWLFGHQKTAKEVMRENQRELSRAERQMDRERQRLVGEEKRTIYEMRKLAKEGQMAAVKIHAKNVVRTRAYIVKFIKMGATLQSVSVQISALASVASMTDSMKKVTQAMMVMNRQIDLPAMHHIMAEWEKQSQIMETKEEMVNASVDEAMAGSDDDEEEAVLIAKVLDEIGVNLGAQLADVPTSRPAAAAAAASAKAAPAVGTSTMSATEDSESAAVEEQMMARLRRLKQ